MADEESKFKHSRRRAKTQTHIEKGLKQIKNTETSGSSFIKKFITEKHRMAKKNPYDCGKAHCGICSNPRKLWGERSIQERRLFQREKELE